MGISSKEAIHNYFKQNPEQLEFFNNLSDEDKTKFELAIINGAINASQIEESDEEEFADGASILLEQFVEPILKLQDNGQGEKNTIKLILDICKRETQGKAMLEKLPEFLIKRGYSNLATILNKIQEQDEER